MSIEYLSTTLSNPTRGQCASCANPEVVLDAVIVNVGQHPTKRNAMNQPITVAVNAHLICTECTRNHPMWSLREEPGIETEAPLAAPSA